MTSFFSIDPSRHQILNLMIRNILMLLLCVAITSVTGCGGCTDKDAKAKADAKKKKEEAPW